MGSLGMSATARRPAEKPVFSFQTPKPKRQIGAIELPLRRDALLTDSF